MENKIYNTISDPMYYKQLIDGYENEEMDQWLLYVGNGAKQYYGAKNITIDSSEVFSDSDYLNFANHCFVEGEKTAFISLGCGNSETEKHILNKYSSLNNYDLTYIGVDTSEEMINTSMGNLKECSNTQIYLRADFGSTEFKNEIENLCRGFDKKVFVFFGGTFGNIKYTKIINILYNFLGKDDKIWIDIGIRKGTKIDDDIKLFEIYKSYLTNKSKSNFLLSRIIHDGINISDGEIILKSKEQTESGAIKFSFFFKFNKKVSVNIKNYNITFLPGYSLKLIQIYRFGVDGFINLLKGHNFRLLEKQTKGYDGQFLFEKK